MDKLDAAAIVTGILVACGLVAAPSRASAEVQGRALYMQHCASCHGARLEGQPNWQRRQPDGLLPAPPHDASGHTWHHSDVQLFQITKKGVSAIVTNYRSAMPAFEGVLSDDQIRAVLGFIKSTWPDEERDFQEGRNRRE